jgi:hypothetical protein
MLVNPDNGITWARTTQAAKTGIASTYMDNFDYASSGQVDELIMPNLDLASITNPGMSFEITYQLYTDPASNPSYSDTLKVLISTDCGSTWTQLYFKYSTTLTTVTPVWSTIEFFPSLPSQWRQEIIPLNAFSTSNNAIIKFRHTTDYENNLFIDDINIASGIGITETHSMNGISISPSLTSGDLSLAVEKIISGKFSLKIYNVLGEVMHQFTRDNLPAGIYKFNLADKPSGIYFAEITTGYGSHTAKIILGR